MRPILGTRHGIDLRYGQEQNLSRGLDEQPIDAAPRAALRFDTAPAQVPGAWFSGVGRFARIQYTMVRVAECLAACERRTPKH